MRHWAEKIACETLQQKGLQLIDHNFSSALGEIDLIMQDGSTLVFIEVRQRSSAAYGLAEETIGHRKQEKIRRVADQFLQRKSKGYDQQCRFDVFAVNGDQTKKTIRWIKSAF